MAAPTTAAQPAPAPLPVKAVTPAGTVHMTLVQERPPSIPFTENPANLLPLSALFGTLLGVGLTIWFGWWKTKKEMDEQNNKWRVDRDEAAVKALTDRDHGAEEARKARLVTARRDVYLELIKEMTAASMALAGIPFQKGEEIDVQAGFQGFLSAAARVAILGEMDTVVKSRELMILVQKVLYKKMPEIIEMRTVRYQQSRWEEAKRMQLEKSESIKGIMTEFLKTPEKFYEVKPWADELERSDAEAKKCSLEVANHEEGHRQLAKRYQRLIIEDTAELAQKTNELIVCIRAELELASDWLVLEETTTAMYDSAKESINKMHEYYAEK